MFARTGPEKQFGAIVGSVAPPEPFNPEISILTEILFARTGPEKHFGAIVESVGAQQPFYAEISSFTEIFFAGTGPDKLKCFSGFVRANKISEKPEISG